MFSLGITPMRRSLMQSTLYVDKLPNGIKLWTMLPSDKLWFVNLSPESSEAFGNLLMRQTRKFSAEGLSAAWTSQGRSDREQLIVQGEGRIMWLLSVQAINDAMIAYAKQSLFSGK